MLAWDPLVQAAVAMLFLVVLGVMVVTTMATLPMEEASTQATSVVMVALLQATMATVAMEALPLVVSPFLVEYFRLYCQPLAKQKGQTLCLAPAL